MFWIFVLYSCLGTFLLEKPLVESTPASVTNITTPVNSISPLMTTASTTLVTTEPSPCQDVNKMNMFILPCIGPLFFTISSAKNATAFCGYVHMTWYSNSVIIVMDLDKASICEISFTSAILQVPFDNGLQIHAFYMLGIWLISLFFADISWKCLIASSIKQKLRQTERVPRRMPESLCRQSGSRWTKHCHLT